MFFRFLSLKTDPDMGMNIRSFIQLYDPNGPLCKSDGLPFAWALLLRVQATCVADFFEKLRLSSGVEMAARIIPPFLQASSLDSNQWFLSLDITMG